MAASTHKPLVAPADIPRRARFQARRTENIVESVIREMTRLSAEHNAVNLAQGFPDFPAPDMIKQAAADAIAADDQSVRHHLGRETSARRHRGQIQAALRPGARPRTRAHRVLRRHRRHDRLTARGDQSRRRDHHLRAALRKLRPRHAAVRRGAQVRAPASGQREARTGASIRRNCAQAFSPRTKAIILNSPGNPLGQVFDREPTRNHRAAVPGVRRAGHHRRDLRAHHLRRRGARAHDDRCPACATAPSWSTA